MSKLVRFLAALALIGGIYAAALSPAQARGGGWHHHGGWHGGYGWRGGFGWGFGYPYYAPPYAPYYGPYYYAPGPYCRWVRVRVWRDGVWVVRRVRRCW